jgi:hypothetical protein
VGKHYSHLKCFKQKKNSKAKFSISSILKKIKLTETIFRNKNKKNTKKKQEQKNHAENTVAIHSVL